MVAGSGRYWLSGLVERRFRSVTVFVAFGLVISTVLGYVKSSIDLDPYASPVMRTGCFVLVSIQTVILFDGILAV